jgi:hypothetical protein
VHTFAHLDASRYAPDQPNPHPAARADHDPIGAVGLFARTDAGPAAGSADISSAGFNAGTTQEHGATEVPSPAGMSAAMICAVTMPVYEACQGREKCIARCALVQNPSERIATFALQSIVQVRRLMGMRIVVGRTLGLRLMQFRGMTMAFGDAQHFPQDRVRTPEIARAWRMRRARLSNLFALRIA